MAAAGIHTMLQGDMVSPVDRASASTAAVGPR
jgi:hypothetical protein